MGDEVLNCDNAGCGHVEQVGTITEVMVGTPCPKCGSDLLTEKDWNAWKVYRQMMEFAREISPPDDGAGMVNMGVGLHNGKVTITVEPINDQEGRDDD